jgi:hypothetical protein
VALSRPKRGFESRWGRHPFVMFDFCATLRLPENCRDVSRIAFATVITRLILDPGEPLPLAADFGDRESPPRPKGASRQVRRQ